MSEAKRVEVAGTLLRCAHCMGDRFLRRGGDVASLYTDRVFSLAAPFVTYACSACGHLHWFAAGAPHDALDDDTTCLDCGALMGPDASTCGACGWTYAEPAESIPEAPPPEPIPSAPEPPPKAPDLEACPHCGAARGVRSTICAACGQIFE
ncbi:MAG: hypothetical protein QNJ98_10965 [Planctomycetota bacterium]|nr:hypothetical protein [Planctomycetota bacterium]